jgi:hypothetical protein
MTRLLALAAIVLCVSCTHSSNQSLSQNGARLLQAEIGAARAAAEQGDYVRSDADIKLVEITVASLRSQELIGASRAAQVLRSAAEVRTALAPLKTTTTTTAPPSPVPPPTQPRRRGEGHGDQGGGEGGD